jgi:ABC-2 type transport system ATP-binding protein
MANVVGKLQVEVFVLSLRARVAEAPVLDGYTVRLRNEHEIEVEVVKNQGLNRLFAELDAKSIDVVSMRTKTNRLEELFIRLVENKHEVAA